MAYFKWRWAKYSCWKTLRLCAPTVSVSDWCLGAMRRVKSKQKFMEMSFCCRTGAGWVASSALTIWPLQQSITWLKGWKGKKMQQPWLIFHWSSPDSSIRASAVVLEAERELNEPRPAGLDKLHLNPVHFRQNAVQGAEASCGVDLWKAPALPFC